MLAQLGGFENVVSGQLSINGVAVSVNVETDSLDDIVSRINASTDVTAAIDDHTQTLSFTSNELVDMTLDDGNTGLLEAVGIQQGTYESKEGSAIGGQAGLSQVRRKKIAGALREVANRLNAMYGTQPAPGAREDQSLVKLRDGMTSAIRARMKGSESRLSTQFGLTFEISADRAEPLRFSDSDQKQLYSSLRTSSGVGEFRELMFGTRTKPNGLIDDLLVVAEETRQTITRELGSRGVFLDLYA